MGHKQFCTFLLLAMSLLNSAVPVFAAEKVMGISEGTITVVTEQKGTLSGNVVNLLNDTEGEIVVSSTVTEEYVATGKCGENTGTTCKTAG